MAKGWEMSTKLILLVAAVSLTHVYVCGLQNGLALTPPMGWLSWERYRCNTDCVKYPDSCISERLYKNMADLLVSEGYSKVGYQYVNIDDCWSAKQRDPKTGALVPDPDRFPSGMKALADYIHSKGLKIGIYGDFGTFTCGGYPGSKFYLQLDAQTFASWGIDMVKLDGCYSNVPDMAYGYPAMQFFLNQTGRPMLYSCSWPAYVETSNIPDYKAIAKYCNIWRNYADIGDSWDSVKGIINFYGKDYGNFSKFAGPGNFNDPDMIIVGDYGLSYDQQQVQMALWAIMASPLLMSNDLRRVPPESKALLQNQRVIAINQDPLGIEGTRISSINHIDIWTRPVSPAGKSIAFAILNLNEGGHPLQISTTLSELGGHNPGCYIVSEVFSGQKIGTFHSKDKFVVTVNPTGVFFGMAEAVLKKSFY